MDRNTALDVLGLKGTASLTEEAIQSAYIEQIKSNRNDENFFETLKNLNVARDLLNEEYSANLPAILKSNSDLTQIILQQTSIEKVREAKREFKQTFDTTRKLIIRRSKRAKDTALFLTALSGIGTFFLTNMKDVLAESSISPSINLMLVLMTGVFGGLAFLSNAKATHLETNIDAFYEWLTRARTTSRLLDEIFASSNTVLEGDFEMIVLESLQKVVRHRSFSFKPSFLFERGFNIDDTSDFVDQYIDYLVNSGRIQIHKNNNDQRVISSVEEI